MECSDGAVDAESENHLAIERLCSLRRELESFITQLLNYPITQLLNQRFPCKKLN
jgi:hypothetical protein